MFYLGSHASRELRGRGSPHRPARAVSSSWGGRVVVHLLVEDPDLHLRRGATTRLRRGHSRNLALVGFLLLPQLVRMDLAELCVVESGGVKE